MPDQQPATKQLQDKLQKVVEYYQQMQKILEEQRRLQQLKEGAQPKR